MDSSESMLCAIFNRRWSRLVEHPLQSIALALQCVGLHGFADGFWLPWTVQEHLAEPPDLEANKRDSQQR